MSKSSAIRRGTARLSWLLLSAFLLPACSASTATASAPEPEIYPIEPVRLTVHYSGREDNGRNERSRCSISVDPEEVTIYYQWDPKRHDSTKDVEVLWKVEGLKRDHTVFIVAKEETRKGVFETPKTYRKREAFYIDGKNNAIRSGHVASLPDDVMKQDVKIIHWKYDVVVVDAEGRELCSVDPEVVVAGHP